MTQASGPPGLSSALLYLRRLPPMIAPGSGTIIEVIGRRGLRSGIGPDSGFGSCSDFDFRLNFSHLMNMGLMIAPAAEPTT